MRELLELWSQVKGRLRSELRKFLTVSLRPTTVAQLCQQWPIIGCHYFVIISDNEDPFVEVALEFRERGLLYSGAFSVTSWDWRVCTAIGKPIQSLFGRVYLST